MGYTEAERLAEELAARLLELVPRSELAGFHYRGVPRGGLVVLGMLSYLLDLERRWLEPPEDPSRPVVLVDDVAVTGARLREFLGSSPARRVLVAHLCSPPALRAAVVDEEPRVRAVVAARDLEERFEVLLPEVADRGGWKRRWARRLGEDRYRVGPCEPVAFAWSEPDRPFWNAELERVESLWRRTPPHRCLAHRARLGGAPPSARAPRDWRMAPELAWGSFDGRLWLVRGGDGEVFTLDGAGEVVFRALAAWGSLEAAVEKLVAAFEVDAETAAADAERFAADLVERGLLERERPERAGRPAAGEPPRSGSRGPEP